MAAPPTVSDMVVDAPVLGADDEPCEPCGVTGGDEGSVGEGTGKESFFEKYKDWIGVVCVVLVLLLLYYWYTSDGFDGSHPMDPLARRKDLPWELKMDCPAQASA